MKKKLIFFSVFLLIVLAIIFGLKMKNNFFGGKTKTIETEAQKNASNQNSSDNTSGNYGSDDNLSGDTTVNIDVTPSDCDNQCSKYTQDKELEYCQQVCGISSLYVQDYDDKNEEPANCDSQKGLQKDYCWKDLAVKNGDFKQCANIADSGIKKTCKDTVTQDVLEKQTDSEMND